ncbi:MAG: DNA polymerase IV, partial [Candidatus Eremiobacteraeota bacterium]|nr:DNA polymerase IV [Candidatus Eremiobacteraeota bacterium]
MIAHFDVDAFYASVEIRDNPSLRGKPVAVAGTSRRAVVLTASYEARPFGVRSAIPLYKALQSCPQLVVVRPDMQKYRAVSREIFEAFGGRGHAVEGLSFDEAFVDCGSVALDEAVTLA